MLSVFPQDAMRSVTKQAIREARLKEIKEELLHSEKLKVRVGEEMGEQALAAALSGRDW
jgi:RNA-binding protein YhbY